MKKTFAVVGCGFLGNIVLDSYKLGLLEDYELIGVTSRTMEHAAAASIKMDCACCADVDALLAMKPDYIVETASVEWVRENAVKVLESGVSLVVISIGAFADLDFYQKAKDAAVRGHAKIHIASGAIGGFDVLQTVTLMAKAQKLAETSSIETHTGCRGFMPTPVWEDALLDTQKTVFTGNAKQAIATFPRRVNVAVATSLATTGPDVAGNHAQRAELAGRRSQDHRRDRRREGCGRYLFPHQRHRRLERCRAAAQSCFPRLLLLIRTRRIPIHRILYITRSHPICSINWLPSSPSA